MIEEYTFPQSICKKHYTWGERYMQDQWGFKQSERMYCYRYDFVERKLNCDRNEENVFEHM